MSCKLTNSRGEPTRENGGMENRIRELREARGWSQVYLGSLIGMGKSDVSRLENGKTQLKLDVAKRIADALDVSIAEVLALETDASAPHGGFAESNVEPYTPAPGDPFAGLQGENRYLMIAKDDALDCIGINAGDVLIVDDSPAACTNPPPLAAVRVQYHPDLSNPAKAISLLRQFIPPALAITNSSKGNSRSIDLSTEDAQILGVVKSTHRALHG